MARPKFTPTQEQRNTVKVMVGCGISQDQICLVVTNPSTGKPISEQTLRTSFREEINTGSVIANAKVAKSLFDKACGDGRGSVAAAIFWMKCRGGWKETQVHEHTGKDGKPIEQHTTQQLSRDELIQAVRDVQDLV